MTVAAKAVHDVAPDGLIFFVGVDSDIDMSNILTNQSLEGTILTPTAENSANFMLEKFVYEDNIVLEVDVSGVRSKVTVQNITLPMQGSVG